MATWAKVLADGAERGEEALGMTDRFEALHDPLSFARWLVRVFRAIIQPAMLPMFDTGQTPCCAAP